MRSISSLFIRKCVNSRSIHFLQLHNSVKCNHTLCIAFLGCSVIHKSKANKSADDFGQSFSRLHGRLKRAIWMFSIARAQLMKIFFNFTNTSLTGTEKNYVFEGRFIFEKHLLEIDQRKSEEIHVSSEDEMEFFRS